jgi:hypothetical protein
MLQSTSTTQYQDLVEKLSAQLAKTESLEQGQMRMATHMEQLSLIPGRKMSTESLPPSYSLKDNLDTNDTIQIKASCYRRSCRPWCSCRCHVRRSIRSPSIATDFLGSLFIGYSGVPGLTQSCNEKQCSRRSQVRFITSYQFPKWMWTRALFTSFMTSRLYGPEMLVRVQNTISYVSETYQCCLNGEVGLLKKRFDNGLASPFDVDPEGVSLLHVSLSRFHPFL